MSRSAYAHAVGRYYRESQKSFLYGKWIKATSAFDLKMCEENRIVPVEFDGKNDAMFHSHNRDGKLHMEYLDDLGNHYDDLPLDKLWDSWLQTCVSKALEPPEQ